MQFLYDAIASLIALFYSFVPNYAVAIILMTLVVMIVLMPLTLKSTRSMMVMQQFQPEIKRLQAKYKDDMQRKNEELMKFYKENNLSPWGGCLPLLVQMPVFLVLYAVLRGLTRPISDMGFASGWGVAQQSLGQEAVTAPVIERPFDPAYLDPSTSLFESLVGQTQMKAFGMDLADSASDALTLGIVVALPYFILIAVVLVSGIAQQRQIQGRQQNRDDVPSQQQAIMKFMPFMLPIFSFGLPAGLVTYFATSNLFRVGQQYFISKAVYGADSAGTGASKGIESSSKGTVITADSTEVDDDDTDRSSKAKGGAGPSSKAKGGSKSAGGPKPKAGGGSKARGGRPAPEKDGGSSKDSDPSKGSGTKASKGKGGSSSRTNGRSKQPRQPSRGRDKADRSSGDDQGPVLHPRARKRKR